MGEPPRFFLYSRVENPSLDSTQIDKGPMILQSGMSSALTWGAIADFAKCNIVGCDGLWIVQKQSGGVLLNGAQEAANEQRSLATLWFNRNLQMTKIRFLLRVQQAQSDSAENSLGETQ